MKFDCGPTWRERRDAQQAEIKRLENWHTWFAWYPVRVTDTRDCRWLETVFRKGSNDIDMCGDQFWNWEYKPRHPIGQSLDHEWW